MVVERIYKYQGVDYPAKIAFKKMKSMRIRYFREENAFRVSVPTRTSMKAVDDFVIKYLPKLLKRGTPKNVNYDGNFLYVFGEKKEVGELEEGEVDSYYRKMGLPYLKERVKELEYLMGVKPPYTVRMRKMKRTYGSNSRQTHTLTFQVDLMAYSKAIIDSVVIHELAHHFHFDHSPKFYEVVYRYCPDYPALRKKLIHHDYEG